MKYSYYKKEVSKNWKYIDPYRIAAIFGITDHCEFQAFKKIICAGKRGWKDYRQDIQEAIDALQRRLEMMDEEEPEIVVKNANPYDVSCVPAIFKDVNNQ